jgi:hypothetical protein
MNAAVLGSKGAKHDGEEEEEEEAAAADDADE